MPLADRVKAAARELGFDAVGICDLRPIERDALDRWLEAGYAGTMRYMHRQAARRREPQRIVPGGRRAVVVLKNHFRTDAEPAATARVARYAWGEDYHRVLGDALAGLAQALIRLGSTPQVTRWYVDAGPVPERELAARAGLGWIAKNTMLIHPELGSFTFIGTLFTDLELPADEPFRSDQCGSCTRCLEACPTGAFPREWMLDARRCISYLTIEHRGAFGGSQGPMIGDWLFGCDVCQDVCPWNLKFSHDCNEPRFKPRPEVVRADPAGLAELSGPEFDRLYGNTAFERAGAEGLARNARQVLINKAAPGSR